ncbi:hypothetical protein ABB37_05500 [Leptomonas pyrrhocoris]|uniref:Uncharacterized protein n=1 Tax=Leptomonas pyrrhocoris TaxID=157538 RepID=A0A0M9G0H7_LEPPY|nr:hypothetical protein ABB37_05500 [Leptomonas pyrrhocoris]XP_015658183.1 hypothetical protein ABB37_05500 [Leptomonas pyrrhocoris]KPA79743.1 hypothetical protein ABB37_05500 [Leptomonas pyrrhocoris]KPA79744.1 hypothetical protein ABB37_05500 [Leptomonas pyrrhocoris]|eukprot:XP_015658182.1 hypothetical protein ABB37_05500 [Leptomonas pyrrhocoris]
MALEQSTAAAISEIDRTLRSLGIRDDFTLTRTQPQLTCALSLLAPELPSRQTSSTQTPLPSRVAAGTQCCTSTCSTSVQHGPGRRIAVSQTDEIVEDDDAAKKLTNVALAVTSIIESGNLFEFTALQRIEKLMIQLRNVEQNSQLYLQFRQSFKKQYEQKSIESEELTERMSLLTAESINRNDLATAYHNRHVHIEKATHYQLQLALEAAQMRQELPRDLNGKADLSTNSAHSSVNDLTELLDQCWRVLEE